jgi:myo-inositol-1-phosphate synthase
LIRIGLAGIGNCASALIHGLGHYRRNPGTQGLITPEIGGLNVTDIEISAAFDVDARKVGQPVDRACLAPPNCMGGIVGSPTPCNIIVDMAPPLDGVAGHMASYPVECRFLVANCPPVDIAERLRQTNTEILICMLPVGSERAARAYAQACLDAGCAMLNCIPAFIASDPTWAGRFRSAGLPIIGDDIKSQLGATVLHRHIAALCSERGVTVTRTHQLNIGGNTDFLNMLAHDRIESKRRSKTGAVQAALPKPLDEKCIRIGPSDYVPYLGDQKTCHIHLEAVGFAGALIALDATLHVEDSPNAAAVMVDAIRYLKLALQSGAAGPLEGPSAFLMKTPPTQMTEHEALAAIRNEFFV